MKKILPTRNAFLRKRVWGPTIWNLMHTLAYIADTHVTNKTVLRCSVVRFFRRMRLPCAMCQRHYARYITRHPLPPPRKAFATTTRGRSPRVLLPLSRWVYRLHNNVNRRLGKACVVQFKQLVQRMESELLK